jgi:DNA-nicking Smr family endonuclease
MKEVREIRAFREIAVQKRPLSVSLNRGKARDEGLKELEGIISGERSIRLSDTQEYVEWINPVYSRELVRELHRGRFAVQDCIDLHGFTLTEAVNALQEFLAEARQRGFRCVKIIHGRGLRSPQGPVLKNAVISFLSFRYRKHVVGFATARKNDSGLGALYVLLA